MLFPGVVTYVKDKLLPLDARADWLVTQDDDSDDETSTADLCKEGRIMYTDHGSFILLNVYVPNAGGQIGQPRMDFKLRYLKALQKTCEMTITEHIPRGMKKLELGSWLIVTCRVRTLNRAALGMRATHMLSRSCAWDPNSQNIPIQGPYVA